MVQLSIKGEMAFKVYLIGFLVVALVVITSVEAKGPTNIHKFKWWRDEKPAKLKDRSGAVHK